ncbi:MAG: hypothetical protein IT210_03675 [Armatimonadetes bacterium]|nr:hypothetical protein [Armatimonadota bacterium]
MNKQMSVFFLLLALLAPARADQRDIDQLLKGVREIVAPGCGVGPVAVFGPKAFPVVTGANGKNRLPVLAATRYGRGRVALAGHEGLYGSADRADQRQLILNTAGWLAGGHKKPVRVLLVDHRQTAPVLEAAGFMVTVADIGDLSARLKETDVLFISGHHFTPKERIGLLEEVARFIERGGGYFDGIPGWGWQQLNGSLSLAGDFGGNRLTARMGLAIADGWMDPTGKEGWLADRSGLLLSHAGAALDALEKHVSGQRQLSREELAQVSHTLTNASGSVPVEDRLLLPRLHALIARNAASALPSPQTPVGIDNPLGRIACVTENIRMRRAPIEHLKAHPAAAAFPGAVSPEAARVSEALVIDTAVPDWHSIGLYAAPGEVIEISLPESAATAGLGVRIGSHTDTIWHLEQWQRFPEISCAIELKNPVTRFGSPFGGIVYITVPQGCRLGRIEVVVKGAVRMPLFVQGKTPIHLWRTKIRAYPAPWAELATDKIILTVPASVVRSLEDPESLMAVWDGGMDAIADLAALPRDRERPERICSDQQISAGYMHSGYPIMTFLDVPPVMADRDKMASGGAKSCWGFWHELGHNHQSGHWTFEGTGETTNNLFSLYCCERVSNEPVARSAWLDPAERSKGVQQYFAEGARFEKWQADPGLSLMFYAQLQQAFGWGAFRRVFAAYRAARPEELPRSDAEKRDQFLVRFSRETGRNLGPFFTAWGIPTSDPARKSIEALPLWQPKDFQKGIPFEMGE